MRFEIRGDPISVAYGVDNSSGVFLAVTDKRLEYDPNSSAKVNAVTEQVGIGDGGGSFFNLHTGKIGFGIKVDDETMAVYLKRYGVSDERIRDLPLNLSKINWTSVKPGTSTKKVGSRKVCTNCRVKTSSCKDCTACKLAPYWYVHISPVICLERSITLFVAQKSVKSLTGVSISCSVN